MSVNPHQSIGTPRPIPSSNLPVRQARPPASQKVPTLPHQGVRLSQEAREPATASTQKLQLNLFGDTAIPKSLALSARAQDMSVNTYKVLKQLYPYLNAEEALLRGMRDLCPDSQQHCQRVGDLAYRLARELDLTDDELDELEEELEDSADLKEAGVLALTIAAMDDQELEEFLEDAGSAGEFHDIGKLAIPDEILNKPAALTEEEYEIVKLHPIVGETMLTPLDLPDNILAAVRGHHEHWDGSGYPDGLTGEEIPLIARILSIVDSFDAMTAGRPYRNSLTHEEALQEILDHAGSQFDPFLAEMFAVVVARMEQRHPNPENS